MADPVVVKVHTAAGGLGRINEKREAITHEVRHRIGQAGGTTDGGPGYAVQAVGEADANKAVTFLKGGEAAGTSSDAPERFRLFKRLLDAKVHQWHHVSRYAHAMGCSEKTLTRICSAMVGVGAKTFIASRLALEAKRLLVHTEMPISAIAHQLGFDEATNFTKFFRSIEGCTPGDFRRRSDVSS